MPSNKPKLLIYFFDKNIPLILYGQHFYHIFATQAAQADQSWFPFAIAVGTVVMTCSYIFHIRNLSTFQGIHLFVFL